MEGFSFLSFEGLNELQVTDLKDLLNFGNPADKVEFPWSNHFTEETNSVKGNGSLWNVHAPIFESSALKNSVISIDQHSNNELYSPTSFRDPVLLKNINTNIPLQALDNRNGPFATANCNNKTLIVNNRLYNEGTQCKEHIGDSNFQQMLELNARTVTSQSATKSFDALPDSGNSFTQRTSQIKLNPSASSFVPQSAHFPTSNGIKATEQKPQPSTLSTTDSDYESAQSQETVTCSVVSNGEVNYKAESEGESDVVGVYDDNVVEHINDAVADCQPEVEKSTVIEKCHSDVVAPAPRSWADVLKTGPSANGQTKATSPKVLVQNDNPDNRVVLKGDINKTIALAEDKLALLIGRHLYDLKLDFRPVFLQPRGLINRRNWCYINATLQALLACPPFYTLLRNLPIGIGVDRGKSSTPVIDSMVKIAYEFTSVPTFQEDMQPGVPFQPKHFYEMLGDLKSDCLKGQQEDAEEFLSHILNAMHEEMVALIRNYEKQNHFNGKASQELSLNGCDDVSDNEDDWQVIGTKQKGMVTRKVVEHKTPISDLLGGQIKSVLTISGSKPSASVQPFFTLQLDIQSENVTSVIEALDQMTVKEPIQGYTCAKTKQEVEAYSRVALQKLPPILILHLKRFVYNKTGGCKKVMKKTEYPIKLELKRDLFSSDVKKNYRQQYYTLFAVMYHDGEEAIKGHYISDIYNHTLKSWIRCDDRAITTNVTEEQVLSHSPPRVPYLLFYQISDSLNATQSPSS